MIKKLLRNLVVTILLLSITGSIYIYKDNILEYVENLVIQKEKIIINDANKYLRNYNYINYKITDDFEPKNYEDLVDIFYTILNSGWDSFFFYCDNDEYSNCLTDIILITETNQFNSTLATINNYINPYNSYNNIKTTISDNGKIKLEINHNYTDEMILEINNKIEEIITSEIKENMSDKDKIIAIHDYIIKNTTYDSDFVETGIDKYKSNTAYGPLINNYAICSGYSDAMALFLDRFNILNYKIASDEHVWNYVYLDGNWLHLDLTWDDPVDRNTISYKYFLITTEKLKTFTNDNAHNYNENLY